MESGIGEKVDEGAWNVVDFHFFTGLSGEDELFDVTLAMHMGAEEDGYAEEDGFKDIMAADVGGVAASDDGKICGLVALVEEAHGVDEDEAFIAGFVL